MGGVASLLTQHLFIHFPKEKQNEAFLSNKNPHPTFFHAPQKLTPSVACKGKMGEGEKLSPCENTWHRSPESR